MRTGTTCPYFEGFPLPLLYPAAGRAPNRRVEVKGMRRFLAAALMVQIGACSGSGNSANNGATSAPTVSAQASSQPSAALAAAAQNVGKDPATALAFVSGMRYEVYPGVFRGADATLADNAGNDYDRALLLHDLIVTADPSTPVRYASCTLSPDQAGAARAAARAAYVAPAVVDNAQMLAEKASSTKLRDGFTQLANFWEAASAQEQTQGTQIAGDFQKAGAQRIAQSTGDLSAIAADHVWVQVQQQGSWLDLDPTRPNAKLGAALCGASAVGDALPDATYDTITASLHYETRDGAALSETTVASGAWRTADLANQSLTFAFAEPSGLQSPAPQPTGMAAYTPLLVAGAQTMAAPPIVVPSASSGPQPVALRLDVTVNAPSEPSLTVSRPIFDRIAVADRAAGNAATAALAPFDFMPFGTVWNVAVNFGTGVVGAGDGKPVDASAQDPQSIVRALGTMQRAYYVTRRAVFADALGRSAPPVIAANPSITFVGLAPYTAGPVKFGLAIDRANEGAAPDGGPAEASLAWGVASVYAERLAVAAQPMMQKMNNLDQLPFADVLGIFNLARNANVAPALVRASTDVSALPASDEAKTRLSASIAGGKSAVVPSKPVNYGGDKVLGWFVLGTDGSVSDEMQNGMHQSIRQVPTYRTVGLAVRCAGVAAGALASIATIVTPDNEGTKDTAEMAVEQMNALKCAD